MMFIALLVSARIRDHAQYLVLLFDVQFWKTQLFPSELQSASMAKCLPAEAFAVLRNRLVACRPQTLHLASICLKSKTRNHRQRLLLTLRLFFFYLIRRIFSVREDRNDLQPNYQKRKPCISRDNKCMCSIQYLFNNSKTAAIWTGGSAVDYSQPSLLMQAGRVECFPRRPHPPRFHRV